MAEQNSFKMPFFLVCGAGGGVVYVKLHCALKFLARANFLFRQGFKCPSEMVMFCMPRGKRTARVSKQKMVSRHSYLHTGITMY